MADALLRRVLRPAATTQRVMRASRSMSAAAAHPHTHTGGTYAHQAQLPRLPVPPLEETLCKYLGTVKPLVLPSEYARTQAAVNDFLAGPGPALQASLVARAQTETNWLERYWDDGVYLQPRLSLPINYNYFLRLQDEDPATSKHPVAWIARAARLLRAMLEFRSLVVGETLAPDREGNTIVDMNQYSRLFSHARVAAQSIDQLNCYERTPSLPDRHYATVYPPVAAGPRHVAVFCDGHIFKLVVEAEDGSALPAAELARRLVDIRAAATALGQADAPVGAFTSLPRDSWATIRSRLSAASGGNAANLACIDQALWVLVLDDFETMRADRPDFTTTEAVSACLSAESPRYLVGRGDGANSWFDKHQLIVTATGGAGVLMEHSPGDGLTALRMLDYMHAATNSTVKPTAVSSLTRGAPLPPTGDLTVAVDALQAYATEPARRAANVRPLMWDLSPADRDALAAARAYHQRQCGALHTSVLHFAEFGATEIKRWQLPPDAFAQMALQLAHDRLYGYPAPTYESTTTRGFAHGRTDTTRSCSAESQAFVGSMRSPAVASVLQANRQAGLLSDACRAHTQYARAAKSGFGVDRHLLGLKNLAAVADPDKMPELFKDPSYDRSRHWRLSTSHCGSSATSLFGFGPVADDGFGVAYMIGADSMAFNITAWHGADTSAAMLAQGLRAALLDCANVGAHHAKHFERIHGHLPKKRDETA